MLQFNNLYQKSNNDRHLTLKQTLFLINLEVKSLDSELTPLKHLITVAVKYISLITYHFCSRVSRRLPLMSAERKSPPFSLPRLITSSAIVALLWKWDAWKLRTNIFVYPEARGASLTRSLCRPRADIHPSAASAHKGEGGKAEDTAGQASPHGKCNTSRQVNNEECAVHVL